jgi:methionine-rich copper-binding protein CopC
MAVALFAPMVGTEQSICERRSALAVQAFSIKRVERWLAEIECEWWMCAHGDSVRAGNLGTLTGVSGRGLLAAVGAFCGAIGLMLSPGVASAHTELDFTLPTDGAAVGEPVTEITVGFTEPVTLVGPGFEVLDPQGNLSQPFVVTDDDIVFRLQIDPPIAGGEVGVRYEVTSEDGHIVAGSFSFTIAALLPTTLLPSPTTTTNTTSTAPVTTAVTLATVSTVTATSTDETIGGGSASTVPENDSNGVSPVVYGAGAVALAMLGFLIVRARRSPAG